MRQPLPTDYAALVLRLSLASMWLAHGSLKWAVFTLPGFAGWLDAQGIPGLFAWPVFLAEILGGLAILGGFYGRYVSLALMPVLLVAAWTHASNGWLHTSPGGGWEYPVFLAAASLVHFLLGDGAFSIGQKLKPKLLAQ